MRSCDSNVKGKEGNENRDKGRKRESVGEDRAKGRKGRMHRKPEKHVDQDAFLSSKVQTRKQKPTGPGSVS